MQRDFKQLGTPHLLIRQFQISTENKTTGSKAFNTGDQKSKNISSEGNPKKETSPDQQETFL